LEGSERQRREAERKAHRPTVLGNLKRIASRLWVPSFRPR